MSDQAIVAELKRLAEERGGLLRPSEIVESAREEGSILHGKFQWDDSEAAHQYRLWQARQLLRVTVQYVGSGDEAVSARVFVSLTPDRGEDGGGYRVTTVVMATAKGRNQLLADALKEMESFQKKYADLQELAGVFSAMRKVGAKPKGEVAA